MTGGDEEVIEYLQTENEVSEFVDSALKIIYAAALNYRSRGFRDLSVAFGCTGGRRGQLPRARRRLRRVCFADCLTDSDDRR